VETPGRGGPSLRTAGRLPACLPACSGPCLPHLAQPVQQQRQEVREVQLLEGHVPQQATLGCTRINVTGQIAPLVEPAELRVGRVATGPAGKGGADRRVGASSNGAMPS
jgi:hypothetical protein